MIAKSFTYFRNEFILILIGVVYSFYLGLQLFTPDFDLIYFLLAVFKKLMPFVVLKFRIVNLINFTQRHHQKGYKP